jgi:hypothetical protein
MTAWHCSSHDYTLSLCIRPCHTVIYSSSSSPRPIRNPLLDWSMPNHTSCPGLIDTLSYILSWTDRYPIIHPLLDWSIPNHTSCPGLIDTLLYILSWTDQCQIIHPVLDWSMPCHPFIHPFLDRSMPYHLYNTSCPGQINALSYCTSCLGLINVQSFSRPHGLIHVKACLMT